MSREGCFYTRKMAKCDVWGMVLCSMPTKLAQSRVPVPAAIIIIVRNSMQRCDYLEVQMVTEVARFHCVHGMHYLMLCGF